jgi:hypothetical protein
MPGAGQGGRGRVGGMRVHRGCARVHEWYEHRCSGSLMHKVHKVARGAGATGARSSCQGELGAVALLQVACCRALLQCSHDHRWMWHLGTLLGDAGVGSLHGCMAVVREAVHLMQACRMGGYMMH